MPILTLTVFLAFLLRFYTNIRYAIPRGFLITGDHMKNTFLFGLSLLLLSSCTAQKFGIGTDLPNQLAGQDQSKAPTSGSANVEPSSSPAPSATPSLSATPSDSTPTPAPSTPTPAPSSTPNPSVNATPTATATPVSNASPTPIPASTSGVKFATCGHNQDKVLICHLPKGKSACARTLCISLEGARNGHGLKLDGSPSTGGDTWGKCKASENTFTIKEEADHQDHQACLKDHDDKDHHEKENSCKGDRDSDRDEDHHEHESEHGKK